MMLILLWLLGPAALVYGITGDGQAVSMALGVTVIIMALIATFAPEK